jgi:SAM-dependent methyltransferase
LAANDTSAIAECCRTFAESYEISSLPAMQAVERSVLGCDYGGTSWTTATQAGQMIEALRLGAGDRLLDIGSGAGWPALYLCEQSGCDVTLVDLPANALALAKQRAAKDGTGERVSLVVASGDELPFVDGHFDAISHSDVLCCLPDKVRVLEECRRVAGRDALMAFNVILIPGGVGDGDRQDAIDAGPPFVDAAASYADMLRASGWVIEKRTDVTGEYRRSLNALVEGLSDSAELLESLGEEAIGESCARRHQQITAIDAGLLARESYVVSPAAG